MKEGKAYREDAKMVMQVYGTLPDKWENRPGVPVHSVWLFDAFFSLSTCRQLGMGVGPIPWTAIRQYADTYKMDLDDFSYLEQIITTLDSEYIAIMSEK